MFASIEQEKTRKKIIRESNNITKLSNKIGSEYLEEIRISIPLQNIFEVVESCHYNYFDEYCPVLGKLGNDYDKHLIKDEALLAELRRTHRYQLQIWLKETNPWRAG